MKAARQQQIVELLNQHHTLTTEALSHLLQVSIETIRRDLSELQKQGRIQRSHGQARVLQRNNHNGEKPFQRRVKSHYAHKSDIARTALAWIDEGMTIALDASSTCWFLARQLPNMTLTVFTNSHPVCVELGRRERIQLISAGGQLLRQYGYYVNPALFSQVKSLLLKRAAQSLLLIDKSKFDRSGEVRIGNLRDVTQIISDAGPDNLFLPSVAGSGR
ncbi:L-fucose operon activator [Klebsiella michiganensis]|uniref:L-fucose operon activator n=1 Tax=Klebsiella michiganensis TaxID=1134687 RepID=UPI0039830A73